MQWILEKKNVPAEDNYFYQFRDLSVSIEQQLQQLEVIKQPLPPTAHLAIDLQKHFLLLGELIEAGTIVPHDESREQYIEPAADRLNKSAIQLYKHFFSEIEL